MNYILLRVLSGLLVTGLMFTSCKKEEERPMESEVAVEDNIRGLAESDEILSITEDDMNYYQNNMRLAATEEVTATYTNSYGAIVTFTPRGIHETGNIVIDFGDTEVQSNKDGKTRKGKIIITFTGKYRVPGTIQTITFDNFYVNGNKVEGIKVLTHKYNNNIFSTTIHVTSGKITFSDKTTLEWSSERVRNWNLNNTPLNLEDDEFSVSGSFVGKSRDGKKFSATILPANPLLWKFSCLNESKFVAVSGIMRITPESTLERVVDYGSGTCDREVTISIGDISRTITLKK